MKKSTIQLIMLLLLIFAAKPLYAQEFSVPILVSDGTNELTLTAGVDPDGSIDFVQGLDQFAPPAPPDGAFDTRIRVGGESYFTKFLDNSLGEKEFELAYRAASGQGPITLSWNPSELPEGHEFRIQDPLGGGFYSADLSDFPSGEITPSDLSPALGQSLILVMTINEVDDEPEQVSAPVFTPPGGTFTESVSVSMSSETDGAEIYYTVDGTDPDETSTLYTAPVELTQTTELRAIALADGMLASTITSGQYVIEFPLGAFDLLSPADGTALTTVPGSDETVTIEWEASANAQSYTWLLTTADGSFEEPLISEQTEETSVMSYIN